MLIMVYDATRFCLCLSQQGSEEGLKLRNKALWSLKFNS